MAVTLSSPPSMAEPSLQSAERAQALLTAHPCDRRDVLRIAQELRHTASLPAVAACVKGSGEKREKKEVIVWARIWVLLHGVSIRARSILGRELFW